MRTQLVASVALVTPNNRVLCLQRSLKHKRFPGSWTLPGGKHEKTDHTLRETAERELCEETGLMNLLYPESMAPWIMTRQYTRRVRGEMVRYINATYYVAVAQPFPVNIPRGERDKLIGSAWLELGYIGQYPSAYITDLNRWLRGTRNINGVLDYARLMRK